MTKQIQRFALSDLRFPEVRAAASRQADALLRADSARRRRMAANDGSAKPAVKKPKSVVTDSPFGVLVHHPLYRTSK